VPESGFTLWHRPTRRHKWKVIGTASTSIAAYALMGATEHRGGNWIVKPVGDDPNVPANGPSVAQETRTATQT